LGRKFCAFGAEKRSHVADVGVLCEQALRQSLVARHVTHGHHQHKVRPGAHSVALLHGGVGHGLCLERIQVLLPLAVQADFQQGRQAMAQHAGQPVGLQQRHLFFDDACLFQPADAAQAGGGGNTRQRRQHVVGTTGIALQLVQQPEVCAVNDEIVHVF
jgi:hypothetical protein